MKPTIKRGPASAYAHERELIMEFSNGKTGAALKGGLISLRNMADGTLRLDIYQHDPGVEIVVGEPRKAAS